MKILVGIGVTGVSLVLLGAGINFLGTFGSRACSQAGYPRIEVADVAAAEYFSSDYSAARDRFLEAARVAGGSIERFGNPHTGPDGEPLFTDVALFGPTDAKAILVLSSGTHGVEGFAGSGIQTGLLREGVASRLPPGISLLMIHAINPFGMAHLRRVNEDNVDLNRNFRDHTAQPPSRPEYDRLAGVIAPRSMGFLSEVGSWTRILWFRLTAGRAATQRAVAMGQYSHPDGLFYGGAFDAWSNRTVRSIAGRYLSQADRVVLVDIHTGLGEFGTAQILTNVPEDSSAYARTVAIWGTERVRTTDTGGSVSVPLDATMKLAFTELQKPEVTAVTLEFGTLPQMDVFRAMRAENWLHHHAGPDHPKAKEIKSCLLRAFHPDSEKWEARVWTIGEEIVEQALTMMSRSPNAQADR